MDTLVRRTFVIALILPLLFASSLQAAQQHTDQSLDRHVRTLEPCRSTLLEEAVRLSPTVQGLVETLERSDLVVYVRCVFFTNSSLAGRLSFLGSVAALRYVVVEVRFHEHGSLRIATLGHELQHAVEIAAAPAVRDTPTLERHYRQIGIAIGRHPLIFETDAARAVGERVHRELFSASSRARAADAALGSR